MASSSSSALKRSQKLSRDEEEEMLLMQMQQDEITMMALLLALDESEKKRARINNQLEAIRSSVIKIKRHKKRDRQEAHSRIMRQYFADDPVYSDSDFRRRFRMRRPLFSRILQAVCNHDEYFIQKTDAVGRKGLTPELKIIAALRYICYGAAMDSYDESLSVGKSTGYEALKRFAWAIINVFSAEYLREPTPADIHRITTENASRGFPGMLGSIDCMHWTWGTCPVKAQGAYRGHKGGSTVILEAVSTKDTWIWKSFFGTPGSNNDINVLNRSPVFEDVLRGRTPPFGFKVNGHDYSMGYYLADGIYPEYATFVKSKKNPLTEKERIFARYQEGVRKDIERTFGIIQKRFAVLVNPAKLWSLKDLTIIIEACIIMHNMIVEDERHEDMPNDYDPPPVRMSIGPSEDRDFLAHSYFVRNVHMRDKNVHRKLHMDLVEHVYAHHGQT